MEDRLSKAKEEQARMIAELDRRVFTIHEVRRILAKHPEYVWGRSEAARTTDPDAGEYEKYCARLLLRLELAYGQEVPGSVVAALMDLAIPLPENARSWSPKR